MLHIVILILIVGCYLLIGNKLYMSAWEVIENTKYRDSFIVWLLFVTAYPLWIFLGAITHGDE